MDGLVRKADEGDARWFSENLFVIKAGGGTNSIRMLPKYVVGSECPGRISVCRVGRPWQLPHALR